MTDFNQAIILGNLTRDPELRYTPNGQSVASFGVATNRRWTNQEGQPQEEVEFHNVVAWGKLAEICNQILYKGRKVLVVGRLRTRSWEGPEGTKRYMTEIVADHISATGAPKAAGESAVAQAVAPQETPSETEGKTKITKQTEETGEEEKKEEKKATSGEEIDLNDIPF